MKVTQESERTFTVVLTDGELDDVMHEAVYSEISSLDVMKSIFLMTFMQVMSCRYFRRMLRPTDKDKSKHQTAYNDFFRQHGG